MMKTILCLASAFILAMASTVATSQPLDNKAKSVALIAAFTARGDMERLDTAFDAGLDSGLSINEIKEILVQMYAYCGFPRSLNALNRFMAKVEQRGAAGNSDNIGPEANPIADDSDMSALGERVRTKLVGRPVKGKVYEFCPIIDKYLRSHLFGDIFARDNLTYCFRELATIGALAAMNLENQLRSHLGICRNLGFSQSQLNHFAEIIYNEIGVDEGKTTSEAVASIFSK